MRLHKRMILGLAAGTLAFALSACSSQGNNQTETPQAASEASETDPSQEAVSSEEGIAETTAGLVQGTDHDGIWSYLGVPYAEAKERFVPAEEVEALPELMTTGSSQPLMRASDAAAAHAHARTFTSSP